MPDVDDLGYDLAETALDRLKDRDWFAQYWDLLEPPMQDALRDEIITAMLPHLRGHITSVLQNISDQLGEGIHTAFRKATDDPHAWVAYKQIDEMGAAWGELLAWLRDGLGLPPLSRS